MNGDPGDNVGTGLHITTHGSSFPDFAAAIPFPRSLNSIDADRVAACGFSTGGGTALIVAGATTATATRDLAAGAPEPELVHNTASSAFPPWSARPLPEAEPVSWIAESFDRTLKMVGEKS